MKLIDITGQRFGRLTVLRKGPIRPSKQGGSNWICQCDCGNETIAVGSALRSGNTQSCGCLSAEWSKLLGSTKAFIDKRARTVTKHGHKRRGRASIEYKTWLGIKARCYRPAHKDYPNWGGRGIKVCDRWLHSFENFLADMGERPPEKTSIDRIDTNGHYEPGNCRWANDIEQGENKRNNIRITIDGIEFTSIWQACARFGTRYGTVMMRIEAGIPAEIAITSRGRLKARRDTASYLPKTHPKRVGTT